MRYFLSILGALKSCRDTGFRLHLSIMLSFLRNSLIHRQTARFFAALLCVFLAGCVVVEDFGAYWEQGFIDSCVNDIMRGDGGKKNKDSRKTALMRSLRVGKHTFLMVREHQYDKGGTLQRYVVDNGFLVLYRLNESKREDFLKENPGSPIILTTETATIPLLDESALGILERVADDDSYWVESRRERYNLSHRRDCIQTLFE